MARFAGDTLHARLAAGPLFQKKDFEASLKRAFLETDEDLRSSLVHLTVSGALFFFFFSFLSFFPVGGKASSCC